MRSKITCLLTAILISLFAVQCDSVTDPGSVEEPERTEGQLNKPELISPDNGATNQSISAELNWKKVDGGEEYRVLISEKENFDSLLTENVVEKSSYKTNSLSANTTYHWKVQPLNSNREGEWSDVWQFTTASEEADPVSAKLTSPENGAEVSRTGVSFEWGAVSDARKYHYQLSPDREFNDIVEDTVVESTSVEIAELNDEEEYHWRVFPVLDSAPSEWSEVWQITTAAGSSTSKAVLLNPEDGSDNQSRTLTFEWEEISGISEYRLQVAHDESFSALFADETVSGNSYEISNMDNDETYYWRVQGQGDNNSENWSPVWSFDTRPEQQDPAAGNGAFVTTRNSDFFVDGQSFRYAGTNAYYLPTYESIDPNVVDRAFDAFQDADISVVRMWGFYDGQPIWDGDSPMQPEAGVYDEQHLRLIDKVIAQGKEHGVRFIIALVNYYPELGGICQYNKWAGIPEAEACDSEGKAMDHFINGSEQQKYYKQYIEMLLNRVNTETGVAYKDEPAIFSWEIMNEGRNPGGDIQELRDWYQEIAQYIKSIDSNHMVSTGEEGYENGKPAEYSVDQYSNTYILRAGQGTSFMENTAIPEIDYGSAHWYPSGWGWGNVTSWGAEPEKDQALLDAQEAWLSDHVRIAENLGKPLLIGEYGYSGWGDARVENIYENFWQHAEKIELDGSLLWQLTADNTKCFEYGGNICWPGGRGDQKLYNGFKNHIQAMDQQLR